MKCNDQSLFLLSCPYTSNITARCLYRDKVITKFPVETPFSFKYVIFIEKYSPFKYVDKNNLN